MEYNKKRQPYKITNVFRVLETGKGLVEYCRVKFFYTGHEQVVTRKQIKTGEFEDESLLEIEFEGETEKALAEIEVANIEAPIVKYIAVNKNGEEFEVLDLEAFCNENGLDIESVQAVIDGKYKTHRKWKFKRV